MGDVAADDTGRSIAAVFTDEIQDNIADIKKKRAEVREEHEVLDMANAGEERIRIYDCVPCGFQTIEENKAKEHGLDYRNVPPDYACLLCVDTFRSLGDLEDHEARKHNTIEQLDGETDVSESVAALHVGLPARIDENTFKEEENKTRAQQVFRG